MRREAKARSSNLRKEGKQEDARSGEEPGYLTRIYIPTTDVLGSCAGKLIVALAKSGRSTAASKAIHNVKTAPLIGGAASGHVGRPHKVRLRDCKRPHRRVCRNFIQRFSYFLSTRVTFNL